MRHPDQTDPLVDAIAAVRREGRQTLTPEEREACVRRAQVRLGRRRALRWKWAAFSLAMLLAAGGIALRPPGARKPIRNATSAPSRVSTPVPQLPIPVVEAIPLSDADVDADVDALFEAADQELESHHHAAAIRLLERVLHEYPTHARRPEAEARLARIRARARSEDATPPPSPHP